MHPRQDSLPKPNWLAWLLLVPFIAAATIFGFFVFLAVLGLVLAGALYFGLRLWWLRRRLRRGASAEVLEGEYVVVRKTQPEDRRLR